MSELADVVAAVLTEHRHKSPRIQARLVLEAIDGKPRRPKPVVAVPTECRCAEWQRAIAAGGGVLMQALDAAESKGRLKQFAWQIAEYGRVGRRTG